MFLPVFVFCVAHIFMKRRRPVKHMRLGLFNHIYYIYNIIYNTGYLLILYFYLLVQVPCLLRGGRFTRPLHLPSPQERGGSITQYADYQYQVYVLSVFVGYLVRASSVCTVLYMLYYVYTVWYITGWGRGWGAQPESGSGGNGLTGLGPFWTGAYGYQHAHR